MSDLVALFEGWLPTMSAQDRADVLKVIDEQIEMTMGNFKDTAKHLASGSGKLLEAWTRMIESVVEILTNWRRLSDCSLRK